MVVLLVVPGLFLCNTQTFLSYNSGIPLETKLQSKSIEKSSPLYHVINLLLNSHTFTHVGNPSDRKLLNNLFLTSESNMMYIEEILSCKQMLNTYGGVPNGKIQGFRAPFLNYTIDTLNRISKLGLLYDSSASALQDDAYWPYTLDYGMANDCWTGICSQNSKIPGLWEIPMYSVLDNVSTPQLMDVYLAGQPEDVTKCTD